MFIVREYDSSGIQFGASDEFQSLDEAKEYIAKEHGANHNYFSSNYRDNTFRLFETIEREMTLDIRPASGYVVTAS